MSTQGRKRSISESEEETGSEFNNFYFSRENRNTFDVIFSVGGCESENNIPPEIFRAHKEILSKGSTVFNAMFNGQMIEGGTQISTIELPDIQPDAFYIILKCIYSSLDYTTTVFHSDRNLSTPLRLPERPWGMAGLNMREFELGFKTTKFLGELLYAADKYNLTRVAKMCENRLNDRLDITNAITIYQLCSQHSLSIMDTRAKNFILKNFDEIVLQNDFLNLTRYNLMTFLAMDEIIILEHDLFLGVLKWAKNRCAELDMEPNADSCRLILDDAVNLIRFKTISSENLVRFVSPEGFLTLEEKCALLESNALRGNSSNSELSILHNSTKPRVSYSGSLYIDVVGPYGSTAMGTANNRISDKVMPNHDIKLTSVTYCPVSKVSGGPSYVGEIRIDEVDLNKTLYIHPVTSVLENTDGRYSYKWIRFDLETDVILKADVMYTITFVASIFSNIGPCSFTQLETHAKTAGLPFQQRYNRRFTLTVYPEDKVIRRIGFTLV